MIDKKHKESEPSGMVGSITTNADCQIFNATDTIWLYGIFSEIDEWSSALNHGKGSGNHFVSDDIERGHSGFSLRHSSCVVFPHLSVAVDGTHRRQMEHLLHLFICDGRDL